MSVRQRAVDLLYAMCDRSNAEEIVSEMLQYLETADYSIREEMVSRLISYRFSDTMCMIFVLSVLAIIRSRFISVYHTCKGQL